MRAVVYDAIGEQPVVREVPPPVCPADGVVVAVGATGVCRSDWHAWRGHDPVELPHIPGHELAGRIVEVGSAVRHFRVGDRVTVPFVCGCGVCETCLAGDAQVCPNQTQPGFTGPGSFAERVALHAADANLVALPDAVDLVTAASLGCRFATAFRALTAHGRVGAGDWLAVYGCGGVGLSAVMIGVALGARVVAVDISPPALALAADLGAEATVNSSQVDPAAAVRELTGGGAQVSLDALGSSQTAVASVRSLRRRGRHLQVGLLLGDQATPPLPMDLVLSRELELYGSHGMAAHE
ncbi:MAG: alcohol dehydrogenase catalytic domain-containing protein, partial [Propionibacteriaceae bacterium]